MRSQALEVYKIFERTYGEEDARVIIKYVEDVDTTVIERVIDSRVAPLATKEELRSEVGELRKEMKEGLQAVRDEMKEEFQAVEKGFQAVRDEMKVGFQAVEKGFQSLREETKSVYATKVELSSVKEELKELITSSKRRRSIESIITAVAQIIIIVGALFGILRYLVEYLLPAR